MPFSPIGKFLPKIANSKALSQASTALALEAGTAFIASSNAALFARIRLVSVKNGMLHALATSAPAKEELFLLKEPLIKAMKSAYPVLLNDLRVEIRGTLAEEQ